MNAGLERPQPVSVIVAGAACVCVAQRSNCDAGSANSCASDVAGHPAIPRRHAVTGAHVAEVRGVGAGAAGTVEACGEDAVGRQRGAGLGLSIVRTFVNMHGGTISAEKREPKGSRIIINLPMNSALAGVAE